MSKDYKYFYLFISGLLILTLNSPPLVKAQGNFPPQARGITPLLTDREYFLSIAVLIFGLIVIVCEVFLLKEFKGNPDSILLIIVTTLIVIAGLFIITAGLTTEQVAPAFGLYGAIVGYLLGKNSREVSSEKSKIEDKNDPK